MKTRSERLPKILTSTNDAILHAMVTYHYLTARQICRLFFSPGSLRYAQEIVKELSAKGFLLRLFLPRPMEHGRAPAVYCLTRTGRGYLRKQDVGVRARYRPSDERNLSYPFLQHTLELNDVLIALALFCRDYPEVVLTDMLHERELKGRPVYVDDGGRRVAVLPDAWLDLHIAGERMCLALELDRGTEKQVKWRQKVRHLIDYAGAPYQEAFKTKSLTLTVLTTVGERRLAELLRWTEAEIEAVAGGEAAADLFRFTSAVPQEAEPHELFLSPRWYRPFNREPLVLLEGVD